jgi:hypothetical protein
LLKDKDKKGKKKDKVKKDKKKDKKDKKKDKDEDEEEDEPETKCIHTNQDTDRCTYVQSSDMDKNLMPLTSNSTGI